MGGGPSDALMQGLSQAIGSTPELATNPGLAVPIAQAGGDVVQNANAAAHVVNVGNLQRAAQEATKSHGSGWFGAVLGGIRRAAGDVVGGVEAGWRGLGEGGNFAGSVLNKGLNVVQHEYRYLHDVGARHGLIAELGEMGAIVGAGVAAAGGVAAAPLTGGASLAITAGAAGVIASEATAFGLAQAMHKDSWQRTQHGSSYIDPVTGKALPGYTDPNTGQPVSFGRDFASMVGQQPGTTGYGIVSGIGDAVFDLGTDPTIKAANVYKATQDAQLAINSADDIVHAANNNGKVRRAFEDMAQSTPAQIAVKYSRFRGLSSELGRASSVDEVTNVIRSAYQADQFAKTGLRLPSITFTAMPINKVKALLAESELPGVRALVRSQQPLTQVFDKETGKFTNHEFDPMSAEATAAVHDWVRSTGQNASTALRVANMFHNAETAADKIDIWRNTVLNGARFMGATKSFFGRTVSKEAAAAMNDEEVQRRLAESLRDVSGGLYPGRDGAIYGVGVDGPIPPVVTSEGNSVQAAILHSQRGRMSLPDPHEMAMAAAKLAGAKNLYGQADNWVYQHVTQALFKKLVLADWAFGFHVGGAEAIMNVLRQGAGATLKARAAVSYQKLAMKYGGDDALDAAVNDPNWHEAIGKWIYNTVQKHNLANGDFSQWAAEQGLLFSHMGGTTSMVHPGFDAVKNSYIEDDPESAMAETMRMAGRGKVRQMGGDEHVAYVPNEGRNHDFNRAWQQQLDQVTKDAHSAVGVVAYRRALEEHRPAPVREAQWYHGTRVGWPRHEPMRIHEIFDPGREYRNLYGGGLYTTDNPEIARDYAGGVGTSGEVPPHVQAILGRLPSPTIYGIGHKAPLNLLNLNKVAPDDMRQAVEHWVTTHVNAGELADKYGDVRAEEIMDAASKLEAHLDRPRVQAGTLYKRLQEFVVDMHQGEDPMVADNALADFREMLQDSGYHGFTHRGGGIMGEVRHRVNVLWHDRESGEMPIDVLHGNPPSMPASAEYAHGKAVDAVELYLQDHPEIAQDLLRAQLPTQGWEHLEPPRALAEAVVQNIRGITTGANGTIHHDLLEAMENGHFSPRGGRPFLPDKITRDYLDKIEDKPARVSGRVYYPYMPSKLELVTRNIQRHVGGIINFMSREPDFMLASYKQYQKLKPLVEDGRISFEDAQSMANQWAMEHEIKFVHNIHERTVGSENVRNFAPFWFAQQQAYKRVGRLLAENPAAFRKYQLMVSQLHNMSSVQTDASGQNYVMFPGSGFLGRTVPSLLHAVGLPVAGSSPVSFSGSLDSMAFVLPGAGGLHPDMGPVVTIPMKTIASLFHGTFMPEATWVAGDVPMNEDMWKQFVPNATVQRLIDAGGANSRGFQSSMMATIQALAYEHDQWVANGSHGTDPSGMPAPDAGAPARQDFINRIKNQTRIMYFAKAALGFVSPLAPQLTVNDMGFKKELNDAIKKAGSVTGGLDAFLKKNPDATAWTVFQSTDPSGFPLPESRQAEDWVNTHMDLIHKYPFATAWLMPQLTDTTYDPVVYNEQLAQGIRVKRTPQEFLDALYIAAGNQVYYGESRPAYEAALKQPGADQAFLRSDFSTYTKNFGLQNPIWYDDFTSQDRTTRRQEAIRQLNQLFNSDSPPQSPMATGIKALLGDYATYQQAQASGRYTKTQLADDFEAYLVGVAQDNVALKPFILSVLGPLISIAGASFSQQAQAAGVAA